MNATPGPRTRADDELAPPSAVGTTLHLMLDGWLVWDGLYGPLRVGEVFVASVEFAPASTPRAVEPGAQHSWRHVTGNRYMMVGLVHEGPQVRVLEVGDLRLLRWARPDEAADPLVDGTTVEVEAKLNLNPWAESDWSRTAASTHATDLRWRIDRITRFSVDGEVPAEIAECSIETVDSATQYCLLDCTLLGDE